MSRELETASPPGHCVSLTSPAFVLHAETPTATLDWPGTDLNPAAPAPAETPSDLAQALRLSRFQQALLHRATQTLERIRLLAQATLELRFDRNGSRAGDYQQLALELARLAETRLAGQPVFSTAGTAIQLDQNGNKLIMARLYRGVNALPALLQLNINNAETARQVIQTVNRARQLVALDTTTVAENINRLAFLSLAKELD